MDRFLMHVYIDYPDEAAEAEVIRLVRGEEGPKTARGAGADDAIPQDAVFEARKQIHAIHVAEAVESYIVDLIFATRYPGRYSEELAKWIQVGASPRGSLALDRCARAFAWLGGRDHVTPDDVRSVIHDCLRHRLMLSYEANAAGVTANQVIGEIVKVVAVA
jgi:MoxR-like ATPase